MSGRTKEIEREEELATKTMSVFYQETVLTPEMRRFIEECVDKKVKEVIAPVPMKVLRRKKKTLLETSCYFDIWIGLLSFLTFTSVYFTITLVVPPCPWAFTHCSMFCYFVTFCLSKEDTIVFASSTSS